MVQTESIKLLSWQKISILLIVIWMRGEKSPSVEYIEVHEDFGIEASHSK